ncbi:MAG: PrsW family intramembrane metalloprotease [Phycisphaerales bacterium]|jgi:RsiW-degrading membrane proteinase PrsW (M82 family)|nr:PrsW family intramembrane metalloprotease [Phycisphaerales bacterium]
MFQAGANATALWVAVIVAIIYLILVRLADMNEKEPLWAVAVVFLFGFVGAIVLMFAVDSITLEFNLWASAIWEELVRFLALFAGMLALGAFAQSRGWSEMGGMMDGIVYGATAGLGFAVGQSFVHDVMMPPHAGPLAVVMAPSFGTLIWTTALKGLADGLFGAIMGAFFGAAAYRRSAFARMILPVIGLAVAIAAHYGYRKLAYGNALGGSTGMIQLWIALLIPLAFIVALIIYSMSWERHAIREELVGEAAGGTVTSDELAVLGGAAARKSRYVGMLLSGRYREYVASRALANWQVELAMTKRRLNREQDARRRQVLETEVSRIRETILRAKAQQP